MKKKDKKKWILDHMQDHPNVPADVCSEEFVLANNQREACQKCKDVIKEKNGRNAFRPTCDPKSVQFIK